MGIRLELLTDPNMLLMFEKSIWGGIIQAVHGHAKADNLSEIDIRYPKELHDLHNDLPFMYERWQQSRKDGF